MAKSFSDYSYKKENKRFSSFVNKQNDMPVFAKGCEPFNFMPHVREMAEDADLKVNGLEIELAMTQDNVDRYINNNNEIDLLISDLLSDYGEDERINRDCEKILNFIRKS